MGSLFNCQTHRNCCPLKAAGPVFLFPLKNALEHLLDAVPKVPAEERVQQRVDAGVKVGDQERQRCEEGVEIRVAPVIL